jgi:DNA-binding CsgD family transcriptional regulator
MTPRKTLAALRQLACLGLPGKAALPDAMEILRTLVDADGYGAFYLGDRCQVIDGHIPAGVPPSVFLDYVENFHNQPHGDGVTGLTTQQAMHSPRPVLHWKDFASREGICKTDFWDRIMRPIGCGWGFQLPLRGSGGPMANLVVWRSFARRDFSAANLHMAEQAQAWLCHLLAGEDSGGDDIPEGAVPTGEIGVLVLDAEGQIVSASPGAIGLWHRATETPMTGFSARECLHGNGDRRLRDFARAVVTALVGKGNAVPARVVRNVYGIFNLRAYALNPFQGDAPLQISLHIERHAPYSQRVFNSQRFLSLSARERDVCLGILDGKSNPDIAHDLDIKTSSVIYYAEMLCLRLGIPTGRRHLLSALFDHATA